MPKKINPKCVECSQVPRDEFTQNRPSCYDYVNCRRKRSYYRNHEDNKLKECKWHKWRQFIDTECFVCASTKDLETHHIHAREGDKDDVRENIVTLCKSCHKVITLFERKLGYSKNHRPRWLIAAEKYPPELVK